MSKANLELKLSLDEKESLLACLDSPGYAILSKILVHLSGRLDEQVLTYDVHKGPDGLIIAKARSDGARSLLREFSTFCENFKKKQP